VVKQESECGELVGWHDGVPRRVGRHDIIRDDLVGVFGSRPGPHGHAEAVLDDDGWPNVDRATPTSGSPPGSARRLAGRVREW
jgi:hypothetical protein